MQRIFASINNGNIVLSEEDIHHLQVLRVKKNEHLEVVADNRLFECVVSNINPYILDIIEEIKNDSELSKDITLFFSLSKGDKNEIVIQKATELGAKRIVLIDSTRSIMKIKDSDLKKKLERYNKIAHEASIQSHRMIVPEVLGVYSLNNIPQDIMPEVSFVAYELEAGNTNNTFKDIQKYHSIGIFIGPEGGYEQKEITYLNSVGIKSISLGKRILRCETSVFYALSVLGYLLDKDENNI